MRELGQTSGDNLCQGSHFRDRTFISDQQDRQSIAKLLTNDITIEAFIENGFQSENSH